ncbi:MAG: C10 family peptidase [Muribaculaceae bacterium]|nr:C10 family peptidase [Muribaculaceae bacterium]
MKKLRLILLLLPAFLYACSDEITEKLENVNYSQNGCVISIDEAISIAIEQSQNFPQEATSRSSVTRTANSKNVIVRKNLSRSGSEPSYYIVNFDDAQGYAIVPAINIGEQILGFVPHGTYPTASNPALEEYLNRADEYIAQQASIGIDFPNPPIGPLEPIPMEPIHDTLFVDTNYFYHLEPRVPQEWGQDNFYGIECPNGVTGCSPLAMATITVWTHFKSGIISSRIKYSYEGRKLDYEDITWAELYKHRWVAGKVNNKEREHLCYTTDPENVHKSISRLCRQIGEDAKTIYRYTPPSPQSETDNDMLVPVLRKYIPSSYTVKDFVDYDYLHVNYYIDRGLLLMSGRYNETDYGHTWIADGYRIASIKYTDVKNFNHPTIPPTTKVYTKNYCLIHMRWGYHGDGDGYFTGDVLTVNKDKFSDIRYIAVYNE